jgi:asparagine synthase (glutamine-hydrolysing)
MCGIAGIKNNKISQTDLQKVKLAISHRGPDSDGIYFDKDRGLGLVHTRLAILDPSDAASQPFFSENKQQVLIFNGEIYNFHYLQRTNFSNQSFKTSSDTELLLKLIINNGLEKSLNLIDGMYAFCLFDRSKNILNLARDRFGEKPLYIYYDKQTFAFSSDLRGLESMSALKLELNLDAFHHYFAFGYFQDAQCIYKNVFQLAPGECLTYDLSNHSLERKVFWEPLNYLLDKTSSKGNELSMNSLDQLLNESISSRMISDVPIGTFLSGGTDSSLVTAIAQSNSSNAIDTFTLGFEEAQWDESNDAREISKILGTNHNELIVNSSKIIDKIPNALSSLDQPISDSSIIPTFIISEFASKKVKVVLSGDGGDELFGGYDRYRWAQNISKIPFPLRKLMASSLEYFSYLPFQDRSQTLLNFLDKANKLHPILKAKSSLDIYTLIVSSQNLNIPNLPFQNIEPSNLEELSLLQRFQIIDLKTYLPLDILVKVDRATMYNSLEARAPFLNPKLLSYFFNSHINLSKTSSKLVLKLILKRYLPDNLIFKPKKGFAVPIDYWLRTSLKDWSHSIMESAEKSGSPFYSSFEIDRLWSEHLQGKRNWGSELWKFLVLQDWLVKRNLIV